MPRKRIRGDTSPDASKAAKFEAYELEVVKSEAQEWYTSDVMSLNTAADLGAGNENKDESEQEEDEFNYLRSFHVLLMESGSRIPPRSETDKLLKILLQHSMARQQTQNINLAMALLSKLHSHQPPVTLSHADGDKTRLCVLCNPKAWSPLSREGKGRLVDGNTLDELLRIASEARTPSQRAQKLGQLLFLQHVIEVMYDDLSCRYAAFKANEQQPGATEVLAGSMLHRALEGATFVDPSYRRRLLESLITVIQGPCAILGSEPETSVHCLQRLNAGLPVGTKLEIWWARDKQFYPGQLAGCDPEGEQPHYVKYDDGEEEHLNLYEQVFRLLGAEAADSEPAPGEAVEAVGPAQLAMAGHKLLGMVGRLWEGMELSAEGVAGGARRSSERLPSQSHMADNLDRDLTQQFANHRHLQTVQQRAAFLQQMVCPNQKLRLIRTYLAQKVNERSAPRIYTGGAGGPTGPLDVVQYVAGDVAGVLRQHTCGSFQDTADLVGLFVAHSVPAMVYNSRISGQTDSSTKQLKSFCDLMPVAASKLREAVGGRKSAKLWLGAEVEAALCSAEYTLASLATDGVSSNRHCTIC